MKKLSVILFVVLFAAVGVLFYLQLKGSSKTRKIVATGTVNESPGQGIVFVNIDSVIFSFDMFTDRRDELMVKQKNAEAELNSKGTAYEKGVKDYQEKTSKGLITRATGEQMAQALGQQQQDLIALRDKLQSTLVEEEQVMNRQVLDYITRFIETNKTKYDYQYILGKSFGGPILYSNSSLDLTNQLLTDLNIQYQSEKK